MTPGPREAPGYDELLDALAQASIGDLDTRVSIPDDAAPDHPFTSLGHAINILLADLKHREVERDRALADLRKLNLSLGTRIEERTRELAAANRALQSFNAMVAHDLRAPIRAVNHLSEFLLEDYGEALGEDGASMLRTLRGSSRRMHDLVEDLFTLSRATKGDLRLEAVDVGSVAREAFAEAREREDAERDVRLEVAGDGMTARADARLLRALLGNLIGNAVKFTRHEDRAEIEVGREPCNEDGYLAFFVRDNGAGFEPAKADRVFGAFQRLHTSEQFEGTGVGLSTVKRIVEHHGGRVWADGRPGEGATFHFTLPEA